MPSCSPARKPVLQRACACGGSSDPTGECAECRREHTLQPKLTVNQPGDRYEQEADRVAEAVMRMPEAQLSRAPLSIQRLEARKAVQRMDAEEDEEEKPLQTKADAPGARHAGAEAPPVVHDVLRAAGRPLDTPTRTFMEARFGHDFSRVRVHAGGRASASAQAVRAQAYTVGRNVVFGPGAYAPGTEAGRRLLAHELTHVVQQGGSDLGKTLQRRDWGILGGSCCHDSPGGPEWGLIGDGTWTQLQQGDCTGTWTDCDGMTCGGAFYKVSNLERGTCRTPRQDDATFRPRRWTPTHPSLPPEAVSPTQRGSQQGDVPPGYVYDPK